MELTSSRHVFSHTGGITVNAVYPSFAIVSWSPPRYRGDDDAPLTERVLWRYSVEWNCSCLQSQTPFRSSAPSLLTFAAIPIHHPGEAFYVRVTSKGTLGGATVALTAVKTAFPATCSTPFPWLRPAALRSPLLYHGLYFAANSSSSSSGQEVAAPQGLGNAQADGAYHLDCGLVVSAYRLFYQSCPPPLHSTAVLLLVAVATGAAAAAARGARRLADAVLWSRLQREDAAVVLCGVGELGGSAALATFALMAALLRSLNTTNTPAADAGATARDDVGRRVFCVAYGTPRRCLLDAPAALRLAACLSGNVLFYTGVMAPPALDGGGGGPFPNVGFASGLPPPPTAPQQLSPQLALLPASGGVDAAAEERAVLNVPLGVRAGPIVVSGRHETVVYGEAATPAALTDEEQFECLDAAHHLALLRDSLCDNCAPETDIGASGEDDLAPLITGVSWDVDEAVATVLRVRIAGRNLQYSPQIVCLTVPGDEPLTPTIVSRTPTLLVGQASLIANVCSACFAAVAVGGAAPTQLGLSVMVQTDMGSAAWSAGGGREGDKPQTVQLPPAVSELLFKACQREMTADAWIVGQPAGLLDTMLSSLPFLVFDGASRDARVMERNLALNRGVRYLCQLASAAEVASHYRGRKPQNGLLAFVEKMAAKLSSQADAAASSMTLSLPPLKEAAYLQSALRELGSASRMPTSAFLARMISWKKRLFVGLPCLEESRYKLRLQGLLELFQIDTLSREQPLVCLELQLYSSVTQHLWRTSRLSASCSSSLSSATAAAQALPDGVGPGLGSDFHITEVFTFEEFFELTHPLFLHLAATATTEDAEAAIVSDVSFLWSVCILLQLRRQYTTSSHYVVAVAGCRGSGCSTVAAALTKICNELTAPGGLPAILVRQVPENALVHLREMMSIGLAISVIVTGELPDYGGLAFSAITRSICGSVANQERQRVHVVLTKLDERLSLLGVEDGAAPRESQVTALVRASTVAATVAAAQASKEWLLPVPVSLSPSLGSVAAALASVRSGITAEEFAAELLQQSIERLRNLILCDIEKL